MAANGYFKTITVSADEWRPLADTRMVIDATIVVWKASGTVADTLQLRFNGGEAAELFYTWTFPLKGVDLSLIEVKGNALYRVTVIGNTV